MLSGKSRKMLNWMMLALESNRVIGPRLAKLMRGGKGARREAERMVSEKIQAAAKAGASLMAGASSDEIVRHTESGWWQTRSGWAGSKDDNANENLLDPNNAT